MCVLQGLLQLQVELHLTWWLSWQSLLIIPQYPFSIFPIVLKLIAAPVLPEGRLHFLASFAVGRVQGYKSTGMQQHSASLKIQLMRTFVIFLLCSFSPQSYCLENKRTAMGHKFEVHAQQRDRIGKVGRWHSGGPWLSQTAGCSHESGTHLCLV